MTLSLAALADLEWLLREDGAVLSRADERAVGQAVTAARGVDAAAARRLVDDDRQFRQELAVAWLAAVRQRQPDLPGSWLERGLWFAGLALTGLGLLLGGGAASTLLAYDGSVPVNVLPFVACFCLLQIVLLVVLVVFVVRARSSGAGVGLLHRPIAWLAHRLGGKGHDLLGLLRVLHGPKARGGAYSEAERWTLFALAQRFGVAFNVGALLAALYAIFFTDLVFSWSTTLKLESETVHAIVTWLALPFAYVDSAVVPLDAVAASQWARMPGEFVEQTEPEAALTIADTWWRFLVAGLVTYGLLPRLVAWLFGAGLARRALRTAALDHAGFQQLYDRVLPPSAVWQGPRPADVVGAAPVEGSGPAAANAPELPGAPTAAVMWGSMARQRDRIRALAERRFGTAKLTLAAAGTADLDADRAAVRAVGQAKVARVAFVAAAGHQPTADVLAFLRLLRAELQGSTPVVVGLVDFSADGTFHDAEPDELEAWRRSLGALDDPYLWVEPMGART